MITKAFVFLLLLGGAGATQAAGRFYRCVSAAGTPIYTDRPCELLDAQPALAPSVILSSPPQPEEPREREPELPPGLCPAPNGEALRKAIERAFARRRVNDFAALYHWVGSTRASSIPIMNRLAELIRHPLKEVAFDPPFAEREWSTDESRLPDVRLELSLGEGAEETYPVWFRLRRHAGCLWISF